jgi:hypothetical protein
LSPLVKELPTGPIRKQLEQQGKDIKSLMVDVTTIKDSQNHMTTAVKALATKGDVETTLDAAKTELKADMLPLESKVVKKIQGHERRISNIEDQAGIKNPEKN